MRAQRARSARPWDGTCATGRGERCRGQRFWLGIAVALGAYGCGPSPTARLRPLLNQPVRAELAVRHPDGEARNWVDRITLISIDEHGTPPTVRIRFDCFELDGTGLAAPVELDIALDDVVRVERDGRMVYTRGH